jgi:hypothetical protein
MVACARRVPFDPMSVSVSEREAMACCRRRRNCCSSARRSSSLAYLASHTVYAPPQVEHGHARTHARTHSPAIERRSMRTSRPLDSATSHMCIWSLVISSQDIAAFERHFASLKPFYFDFT